MSQVKTIGVVGTGVIGASWTALFLAHGYKVLVADPGPGSEEKLAAYLKETWPVLKQLGLTEDASLDNYKFMGSSLGKHYAEVDYVQENAPERVDLKTSLMAEITEAVRPDVVVASSSSGLPSSKFISKAKNPERVLIGHPFNPPHLMPLVEIVGHPGTSPQAIDRAKTFYNSVGKRPIVVKQETPGFVANRLQAALVNEAYSLVSRGVLSAEDLDAAVTTSLGPRWAVVGPFLANAMGGGGGSDGFRHLLEHLGPASQKWVEDMRANEFKWNQDNIDAICASVDQELKGKDIKALEQQRDAKLVGMFKIKGERRASSSAIDIGR